MGFKNDDEEQQLPLTSAHLEEASDGPPLYSESTQFIASDSALTPPEPKAKPDEVRDYIIAVLIRSRGLGLDHARRVAAKWTIGTGRELRHYPGAMFRDIFGLEDGWVVYKEVRVPYYQKEKEKDKKKRPWYFIGVAIGCAISALLFTSDDEFKALVGLLALLPGGALIAVSSTFPFVRHDPELRAENELKNDWNKITSRAAHAQ